MGRIIEWSDVVRERLERPRVPPIDFRCKAQRIGRRRNVIRHREAVEFTHGACEGDVGFRLAGDEYRMGNGCLPG